MRRIHYNKYSVGMGEMQFRRNIINGKGNITGSDSEDAKVLPLFRRPVR